MADEEGFDIGRDLPVSLVLDKTEYICQNDEGEGAAEAMQKFSTKVSGCLDR